MNKFDEAMLDEVLDEMTDEVMDNPIPPGVHLGFNMDAMDASDIANRAREDAFSAMWIWDGNISWHTFAEERKALDFYNALGDIPKCFCPAPVRLAHNNENTAAKFLADKRRRIEEQMKALGLNNEVSVPDEVDCVLRDALALMQDCMANKKMNSKDMKTLMKDISSMLIDEPNNVEAE